MRSILSLAAAIVLVAATSPGTATAAAPVRASSTQTGLLCEFPSVAGDVLLQWQSFDGSMFASILIWAPDAGPDDPPAIATVDGSIAFDGTTLEVTFDLATVPADETEWPDPAGSARMTAMLTDVGPEELFDTRTFRDGNRKVVLEQTTQDIDVTGDLVIDLLDGTRVDQSLDDCGAGSFSQTLFATNPNAYHTATDQLFLDCAWQTDAGSFSLFAIDDDFTNLAQMVVQQGDRFAIAFVEPSFTVDAFEASFELVDLTQGAVIGSARADASLSGSGERINDVRREDPYRLSVIGEGLSAAGTLTVDLDGTTVELPLDDASCDAGDVRIRVMEKMPRG